MTAKLVIQGKSQVTAESEEIISSVLINAIPQTWHKISYPSLKNLINYLKELKLKVIFLNEWIDGGVPKNFWLPGFYFT